MRNHFNLGTDKDLSDAYPLTQATIDGLGPNTMVSPCPGVNHLETYGIEDVAMPGSDRHLEEHEDVEKLRLDVAKNVWPEWFLTKYGVEPRLSPLLIKYANNILTIEQRREQRANQVSEATPALCSEIVKMDHPFQFWDGIITPYAMDEGIAYNSAHIHHEGVPFVESVGIRGQAHCWIYKALAAAFEVKYYLGRARPSEFNAAGESIERYECPHHAEAPAGHGAFAGASAAAFEKLFDATPAQIKLVADAAKQIAMFRSFSAMHIPSSNSMGYELGHKMTMAAGADLLA